MTSVVANVQPACSGVLRYCIGLAVSPSRGKSTCIDFTDLSGAEAAAAVSAWARIWPPKTRW